MADPRHASLPLSEHSTKKMSTAVANARCEASPAVLDGSKYALELADIRKAVENHGGSTKEVDDATFLRFLRARSMNVEKAAKMFVQYQKWRALYAPLGYIPENEVASELASNKIGLQGLSKKGYPLMLVFAHKHYPNKHDFEMFKRFVVHLLDKTVASAPSGVEQIMVIVDLKHFGYKNADVKGMATGFQLLQNYYPERLGVLYMVNTPKFFANVWKVVSLFLEKETRDKIVFLESHKMTEVLVSEVNVDTLPSIYGGKADIVLLQDAHLFN